MNGTEIMAAVSLGINVITLAGVAATKITDIKYLKKGQDKLFDKIEDLPCMIPHCPGDDAGGGNGKERRTRTR